MQAADPFKMQYDVAILEDDEDLGQMVEFMLQPLQLSVVRFTQPTRFIDGVSHGLHCRLLIMDMLLSGGDGREICMQLRASPKTSNWKMLLMSAHPDAETSCLQAGANSFIAKPFDLKHFRQRVLDLLPPVASSAS